MAKPSYLILTATIVGASALYDSREGVEKIVVESMYSPIGQVSYYVRSGDTGKAYQTALRYLKDAQRAMIVSQNKCQNEFSRTSKKLCEKIKKAEIEIHTNRFLGFWNIVKELGEGWHPYEI